MLIKPSDIRTFRPIADNIDDTARIEPYIREAETLRLVDVIGAPLYRWLDTTDFSTGESFDYTLPSGKVATITAAQYDELMHGGYYTSPDGCCGNGYSEGLVAAVSYIAYARFVVNNPINITAFGVKSKSSSYSENVSDAVLIRSANEAQKIGEAYLAKCVEQLKSLGLIECRRYTSGASSKYHVIGKKGL